MFQDINEVVRDSIRYVSENGHIYSSSEFSMNQGKLIQEVFNSHTVWNNPRRRLYTSAFENQPFRIGLAVARFFYLLSGSNYLAPISFYTSSVSRFSDDGITVPGSSYGNRIFGSDGSGGQFQNVAGLIKTRPDSKRGEIAVYWPHDAGRESRDIPCVSNLVFMPRADKLDMTLQMRANDVAKLMSYNLFEFSLLMECMAAQTGLKLGNLHHTAVSLHLRGLDIQLANTLVSSDGSSSMTPITTFSNSLRLNLVEVEKQIRTKISHQEVTVASVWYTQIVDSFEPIWQDMIGVLLLEAMRCVQTCIKELLWLKSCMIDLLEYSDAIQSYDIKP